MLIRQKIRAAGNRFRSAEAGAVPGRHRDLEAHPPAPSAALAGVGRAGRGQRARGLARAGGAREPAPGRFPRPHPPREPALPGTGRCAVPFFPRGIAGAGGSRHRDGPGRGRPGNHRAGRPRRHSRRHRHVRGFRRDGRGRQGAGIARARSRARSGRAHSRTELRRAAAALDRAQRLVRPNRVRGGQHRARVPVGRDLHRAGGLGRERESRTLERRFAGRGSRRRFRRRARLPPFRSQDGERAALRGRHSPGPNLHQQPQGDRAGQARHRSQGGALRLGLAGGALAHRCAGGQ